MRRTPATPNLATSASRPATILGDALSPSISSARVEFFSCISFPWAPPPSLAAERDHTIAGGTNRVAYHAATEHIFPSKRMHSMTSEPSAVSRLPALHEPPQDPTVREIFGAIVARGSRILNIHRVVALAPKMIAAQVKYATAMRQESSLPRPLQQLLILRTLQVNNATYELSVHRGVTLALGVP